MKSPAAPQPAPRRIVGVAMLDRGTVGTTVACDDGAMFQIVWSDEQAGYAWSELPAVPGTPRAIQQAADARATRALADLAAYVEELAVADDAACATRVEMRVTLGDEMDAETADAADAVIFAADFDRALRRVSQ